MYLDTGREASCKDVAIAWNLNRVLFTMHFTGFYKPDQAMNFSHLSLCHTLLHLHSSERNTAMICAGWGGG